MSLFSSAMSRGEVNNREIIRLPRVENGRAMVGAAGCVGFGAGGAATAGVEKVGSVVKGLNWWEGGRDCRVGRTANVLRDNWFAFDLSRARERSTILTPPRLARNAPSTSLFYYYYFHLPNQFALQPLPHHLPRTEYIIVLRVVYITCA